MKEINKCTFELGMKNKTNKFHKLLIKSLGKLTSFLECKTESQQQNENKNKQEKIFLNRGQTTFYFYEGFPNKNIDRLPS